MNSRRLISSSGCFSAATISVNPPRAPAGQQGVTTPPRKRQGGIRKNPISDGGNYLAHVWPGVRCEWMMATRIEDGALLISRCSPYISRHESIDAI
jgi:hypothetical protein